MLADKAYTSRANRGYLRRHGIKATIPSRSDQDAHRRAKGSAGGITHAHMATVLETFRERPDIDLVHDHLEVVGPSVLGATDGDGPPVLQTLGVVHLGVDLAAHRFRADNGEDYLVLGRVTPFKGRDVAARLCKELGMPLVMAGPVAGVPTPRSCSTPSRTRPARCTATVTSATTWTPSSRSRTGSGSAGWARSGGPPRTSWSAGPGRS